MKQKQSFENQRKSNVKEVIVCTLVQKFIEVGPLLTVLFFLFLFFVVLHLLRFLLNVINGTGTGGG